MLRGFIDLLIYLNAHKRDSSRRILHLERKNMFQKRVKEHFPCENFDYSLKPFFADNLFRLMSGCNSVKRDRLKRILIHLTVMTAIRYKNDGRILPKKCVGVLSHLQGRGPWWKMQPDCCYQNKKRTT